LNAGVRANDPELVKIFIDHTPPGRAGKPDDIVGAGDFPGVRSLKLCHRFDRDGGRRVPGDLNMGCVIEHTVVRGLDPRTHPSSKKTLTKKMDCRVEPGNDILDRSASTSLHVIAY
jgi:hypothetical protein